MQNFYDGREMVFKSFKNRMIPLVNESYSKHFEVEPEETDIYWVEKPEELNEFVDHLKNEVKEGFKVNFEESPVLIYLNKIKNRIVFKIKPIYKLELLTNETMRLLGDGPIIDTDKKGVNMPELVQVHFVLLHCNDYLQNVICFWSVTFY